MPRTTPEGEVKKDLMTTLAKAGMIKAGTSPATWPEAASGWYYMPVQNGMGVNGIPDFVGFRAVTITPDMVGTVVPVFLAVETKAPGSLKNLSPNQKQRIAEIERAGGAVVVTDDGVVELENTHGREGKERRA